MRGLHICKNQAMLDLGLSVLILGATTGRNRYMPDIDETHDPDRRSWVRGADDPDTDFPIQNLPFGAFSQGQGPVRIGVAIGPRILDLSLLEAQGVLRPGGTRDVFQDGVLNPFMALPPETWRATRRRIADLLDVGATEETRATLRPALVDLRAQLHRFLRLARTRHQCGRLVPRPGERAQPELAAHSHRL